MSGVTVGAEVTRAKVPTLPQMLSLWSFSRVVSESVSTSHQETLKSGDVK